MYKHQARMLEEHELLNLDIKYDMLYLGIKYYVENKIRISNIQIN